MAKDTINKVKSKYAFRKVCVMQTTDKGLIILTCNKFLQSDKKKINTSIF